MPEIIERRQRLVFDQAWQVEKWDEAPEFVGSFDGAFASLPGDGTKAADVIGVRVRRGQPRLLLAAEFKDFTNPEMPAEAAAKAAAAATSEELAKAVIRKVIDSLCGATFSHDFEQQRSETFREWRSALGRATTRILILVCIELPKTQAPAAGPWTKDLQKRLRWLGPDATVLVTTSFTPFMGDGVEYKLAGP